MKTNRKHLLYFVCFYVLCSIYCLVYCRVSTTLRHSFQQMTQTYTPNIMGLLYNAMFSWFWFLSSTFSRDLDIILRWLILTWQKHNLGLLWISLYLFTVSLCQRRKMHNLRCFSLGSSVFSETFLSLSTYILTLESSVLPKDHPVT